MALALLARACLRQHKLSAALEANREAQLLLDQLGSIEDGDALVRLIHAETLEASGDGEAAQRAFEQARDRLLERAARIGEEGLRQSFLSNVPEHAETLARAG
jgi:hypothetical protein